MRKPTDKKRNAISRNRLRQAREVFFEWMGDALKDDNSQAAGAFAVGIDLIERELNRGGRHGA